MLGRDCSVVAPHFERLASPRPTEEELLLRARRLRLALNAVGHNDLPVTGIGHSIGATMLVALAGGQIWMGPDHRLEIKPEHRLSRLVVMAPPTGFFRASIALDSVNTPIQIWVGTNDTITPPEQANFLKQKVKNNVQVNFHLVEGGGHFSFMNTLPPQVNDLLPNREEFLDELGDAISNFVLR